MSEQCQHILLVHRVSPSGASRAPSVAKLEAWMAPGRDAEMTPLDR
jgi:hypothetical protein